MRYNIKPCPFCGMTGKITKSSTKVGYWYHVSCVNEDCRVQPTTLKQLREEDAVEVWNKRTDELIHSE